MTRKSGAFDMRDGDRVIYDIDGRHGVASDFTQDGDVFIKFDDGTGCTVKWNNCTKERKTFITNSLRPGDKPGSRERTPKPKRVIPVLEPATYPNSDLRQIVIVRDPVTSLYNLILMTEGSTVLRQEYSLPSSLLMAVDEYVRELK